MKLSCGLNLVSLCNLCVLCVSVVVVSRIPVNTESQRTQRLHREEVQTKTTSEPIETLTSKKAAHILAARLKADPTCH